MRPLFKARNKLLSVFSILQLLDTYDRPAYFIRNVRYEHFKTHFVFTAYFIFTLVHVSICQSLHARLSTPMDMSALLAAAASALNLIFYGVHA